MHHMGYVPKVRPGDPLSATAWNRGAQLAGNVAGVGSLVEGSGVLLKPTPPAAPAAWEHYELKTDLTPGGTADAYLLQDDGIGGLERVDPAVEVEVRDVLGTTRGAGADDEASPSPLRGTILSARQVGEEWHIVAGQPWPLRVRGRLTADLETTDTTFKIDGVAILAPIGAIDIAHQLDGSGELTVHNSHGWEGDDNGVVRAEWNEAETQWEAYQVDCPA